MVKRIEGCDFMKRILSLILLGSLMLTGCSYEAPNPNNDEKNKTEYERSSSITMIPTLKDTISGDSIWCATFQLVWNDMKNEVVKQDIVFQEQPSMVNNLNKEGFTADMLSDEYYYKAYGLKTLKLKEQIEKGIKDKFNETSDILDDFGWDADQVNDENNPDISRYFFYAMLKREFEFPKVFTKLDNGTFADKYNNVRYFGIDGTTKSDVYSQVKVLFYNSEDDFAVSLQTKNNDEVVLYKSPKGENFEDIYNNLKEASESYTGKTYFTKYDSLKVPYIKFDEKKEYTELANKPFMTADGNVAEIDKAIQTIKFELDEKGGKIKSEAGISMKVTSMAPIEEPDYRYFHLDNTYAMFLKEKDKDVPYFAALIANVENYQ